MFYYLSAEFTNILSYLNLFNYISFRTGASILTSLFFSLIFGEMIIKMLAKFQPVGQPIRIDGPKNHIIKKAGTPTMGGILILASMSTSILLWADLSNRFVWICFISSLIFGLIGFFDDYQKIKYQNHKGTKVSTRIFLQIFFSFIIVTLILLFLPNEINTTINFPFFKNLILDMGIFYYIVGILVIVGSANAVNLTDGLD